MPEVQAGNSQFLLDPLGAELRADLGAHLLALREAGLKPEITHLHHVMRRGAQAHLDPLVLGLPARDVLEPVGTAVWLGMHKQEATIPAFDLVVREQRVQGSFAYTNPEFAGALGLLESGLLQPGVSRRSFPLGESADVFRGLLTGVSDGFLKAILLPGAAPASR